MFFFNGGVNTVLIVQLLSRTTCNRLGGAHVCWQHLVSLLPISREVERFQ